MSRVQAAASSSGRGGVKITIEEFPKSGHNDIPFTSPNEYYAAIKARVYWRGRALNCHALRRAELPPCLSRDRWHVLVGIVNKALCPLVQDFIQQLDRSKKAN